MKFRGLKHLGGLHNRLTHRLLLKPFTLGETKAFFELNHVKLPLKDIAEIYMCVGGIPFYLKDIKTGYSVPKILDKLFFDDQATLKNEFQNLYAALFKNSKLHEKVVTALAGKNKGLTRNEIIQAADIISSGDLTTVLEELAQCGFIRQIFPILKSKEDCLYRLGVYENNKNHVKRTTDAILNHRWFLVFSLRKDSKSPFNDRNSRQ